MREGSGDGLPGGNGRWKTKTSPGWRGLTPLVARPEPYRPRFRAGVSTLPALAGWRVRHRARTLSTALDNVGDFLSKPWADGKAKMRENTLLSMPRTPPT